MSTSSRVAVAIVAGFLVAATATTASTATASAVTTSAATAVPASTAAGTVAPLATGNGPGTTPSAPAPRPAPPVVSHRPATWPVEPDDLGPLVVAVQQRLLWLGAPIRPTHVMDAATVAAVRAFRVKFGFAAGSTVTASVYRRLDAVTRAHGVLPRSCRTTGLVLCIDKTQMSLRLVSHGRVLATVDARFGSSATPTREGVFRVYRKSRDHVSTLYHSAMPYSLFFAGGQAVHYSAYFRRDGYAGRSHGCVNLRDLRFAAALFARTPIGTRVVVHRS